MLLIFRAQQHITYMLGMLYVCLSVTWVDQSKTVKVRITGMQLSLFGSSIHLVFPG